MLLLFTFTLCFFIAELVYVYRFYRWDGKFTFMYVCFLLSLSALLAHLMLKTQQNTCIYTCEYWIDKNIQKTEQTG